MDACDPTINIKDIKTLIKQNTGANLKLSRSQICDVYATTQDGKLPLPPLIMSSDRSFLYDRKSPLTRLDFEKLFSSSTKVASIRRIAKKVGVSRHADPSLTKAQLVDIIGKRLKGLNIHEPIRLRTVPKKKTENSFSNLNSNNTLSYNNNINRNDNRNGNGNGNGNGKNNGNREEENTNSNTPKKIKFKSAKLLIKKSNSNSERTGIYSATKMVNRGRERKPSNLFNKYFNRRSTSNRVLSSNQLAAREAEKVVFFSNTAEKAYKKLVAQGKINESFSKFKDKYNSEKKKYYKITNVGTQVKKTPFKGSRISLLGRQRTNISPQTPQPAVTRNQGQNSSNNVTPQPTVTQVQVSSNIVTPQSKGTRNQGRDSSNNVPQPVNPVSRNLNANFKKEQEQELQKYLNDNEIANQSVRNGFIKLLNNGTNLANIKTKIRNQVNKNKKEKKEKNNANKRRTEGNTLRTTYNKYNNVSNENKNKIISNYVNGKKKQVRTGLIFRGTKNGNGPMYASIANVEKEISNRNAKVKANAQAKQTKERLEREAKEIKDQEQANRNAKKEQNRLNKEKKEENNKLAKASRQRLVATLLQQRNYAPISRNPVVLKIAERYIEQKPFAAKNIEGVEKKIRKVIKTVRDGNERQRRASLAQYAKAKGLSLNNKNVIELIKNPTSTNTNIDELVEMRKQEKQKREDEVQGIRNDEENVINTNVNAILKNYVNGKSEYTNINKVKEAVEKVKKNKGLIAEQKVKNKEKLERKVETYKGSYGNTFNTVSKPVLNAFNKGTINYKTADKELNKLVQKKANNNAKSAANKNNATNLARKQTGAIALRNTYKNKLNDPAIQKIISNFETRKTKGFFSSNVKYKTINNANAAIRKIQQNKENKQAKLNKKEKNNQNKINKKESEKQANVQKRQESRKEFEQFLKNQTNPRLSYENIMKIRSISLLHNHVHLRGKNVSVAKEEAKKIIDDKKKEILKSPNKISSKNTENINNKVKRINQEAEKRKLANLEESKQKQAKNLANAAKAEKERRNAAKAEKERRNAILEAAKKKQAKDLANAAKAEKEKRNAKKREEDAILKAAKQKQNKLNARRTESLRRELLVDSERKRHSKNLLAKNLSNIKKRQNAIIEDAKEKAEENSSAFFALADDKKAKAEKAAAANRKIALEKKEAARKIALEKKAAAQNRQLRASLTKKVKSAQMDQKVKNKLLNQLKNYSVPIKNVAPSIEQTIKSEKLNGNLNEAENRKKRQQVKKNIADYISKKVPNMPRADRKKYIDQANLKQWKMGIFTGSQGMSANQAFERIRKNINKNISAKIKKKQDEKEIANRERKRVQAKLINAMRNNKPPPPQKNKKANLKKLVNKTMGKRAAKNVNRLKKNINEGVSEMTVKTRLAQLNKQTKYQK